MSFRWSDIIVGQTFSSFSNFHNIRDRTKSSTRLLATALPYDSGVLSLSRSLLSSPLALAS
ncbi:hypothetical protein [Nostoc sp.]|uniref:hypothetical protein n=1 Tax=Nostoc sp. TaxID=1180 RepID=UPI002FF7B31D